MSPGLFRAIMVALGVARRHRRGTPAWRSASSMAIHAYGLHGGSPHNANNHGSPSFSFSPWPLPPAARTHSRRW